jgi:prepilin-type processing-associated H-X9-DG protein
MKRRDRVGFSLTELLVVMCIIIILMSILVVGLGQTHTEAERLRCQHHLEELGKAAQMWSNKNHGRELPAVGARTGLAAVWCKTLVPYLSAAGNEAEATQVMNCPVAAAGTASAGAGDGMWVGVGPNVLFSADRYRTWYDFVDLPENLRSSGWPGTIHYWHRMTDGQPLNPIDGMLPDYDILVHMDGYYSSASYFTGSELAALGQFQENGRSVFVSSDHHASFTHVTNQLCDHFKWGLESRGLLNHCESGTCLVPVVSDHPIGNGVDYVAGYNSEGIISLATDSSLKNPNARLVVYSGLHPEHALTGVLDDGKIRVVVDNNWTKLASPGWYYQKSGTDHLQYMLNCLDWLRDRPMAGITVTYGYNNAVGSQDAVTGKTAPRPANPGQVVRILDYADFIADHDGAGEDDPAHYVALRHGGRANVLFMDGHVEALDLEAIRRDDWARWRMAR